MMNLMEGVHHSSQPQAYLQAVSLSGEDTPLTEMTFSSRLHILERPHGLTTMYITQEMRLRQVSEMKLGKPADLPKTESGECDKQHLQAIAKSAYIFVSFNSRVLRSVLWER